MCRKEFFNKINKHAVPKKACRQGKKSKIDKMCSMIIPHIRVDWALYTKEMNHISKPFDVERFGLYFHK